jgi:hypothetical protein
MSAEHVRAVEQYAQVSGKPYRVLMELAALADKDGGAEITSSRLASSARVTHQTLWVCLRQLCKAHYLHIAQMDRSGGLVLELLPPRGWQPFPGYVEKPREPV